MSENTPETQSDVTEIVIRMDASSNIFMQVSPDPVNLGDLLMMLEVAKMNAVGQYFNNANAANQQVAQEQTAEEPSA